MKTVLEFMKTKKFIIPAVVTVVLTGAVVALSTIKKDEPEAIEGPDAE